MKLSNHPCDTCKVDTLHNGPTCTICGTIMVLGSNIYRDKMNARRKRFFARYGAAGETVMRAVAYKNGTIAGRKAYMEEKSVHSPEPIPTYRSLKFGRERTKV